MKKFRFGMFVAALLVLASINSKAQTTQGNQNGARSFRAASGNKAKESLEETIMKMEKQAWEAVKARDAKAFSDLFAADGYMADNAGFATRASFLQTLPDLVITQYTLTDFKVMMIDKDAAIITYKANVKGSFKGQAFPPNPAYVSSIWAKRGGKWMAVYHQETLAQ
ncbi:MAG: nuclear transport factor 2 family protein [Pyrinomonadaceae bacterium]|nr:nuclear transport factor 2 family protein [Pyrinomonadaceae bacterium]